MKRDGDYPRLRLVAPPPEDAPMLHVVAPRSDVIPLRPVPEPPELHPDDPPRGAA